MRIALVADGDLPCYGDCSRDPAVLAAGLRTLGHIVTGPISPTDPVPPSLDELRSELAADVVVSLGLRAPVASAVLAETHGVPLVIVLPADLLLATAHFPLGYGRLLCRYLPSVCLIVESERQRSVAERFGAHPHSVFVVPPGLALPEVDAPPPTPADEPLRILCDASATSPAEQAFVANLVARLREMPRAVTVVTLTAVTESAARFNAYRTCDIVIVPSRGSAATVAALRAMAAKRPLLASDCPAIQGVISSVRQGVLARPGALDEWLDKLSYLLTEAPLRAHLGRGARVKVETDFALSHALHQLDQRLHTVTSAWNYRHTPTQTSRRGDTP